MSTSFNIYVHSGGLTAALTQQQHEILRQGCQQLWDEVAHLAEQDLAPADFYREFLARALMPFRAPAGGVWIRTPFGNLRLEAQINRGQVGLDKIPAKRRCHPELLRRVCATAQPVVVKPRCGFPSEKDRPAVANLTDYILLLAPIRPDQHIAGLVEVWVWPEISLEACKGYLQFVQRLADRAIPYIHKQQQAPIS